MSTNVGSIHYDLSLDTKKFDKDTSNVTDKISGLMGKIKLISATAATAFVGYGLQSAASLETARQGFVTLLGSAQKADDIMSRIKKEAARTPFEIAGLSQAAQLLTSVTKDGDKAVDFLLDVGESLAAMGKGQEELDRIIVNLQQIGAVGKASMLDIKQFAFAGIPIFEMLQETTGKTGQALEDMISNGEVTFEMLEKMFKDATDEGGRFAGAFKNQSGTFKQSVSNMKDSMQIFASDFVKQTGIFDLSKKAISGFTDTLNNSKGVIIGVTTSAIKIFTEFKDVIIALAVSFGVLKGAAAIQGAWISLTTALLPMITAVKTAIATFQIATITMGLFKGAAVTLSAFLATNALGIAIAALAGAYAILNSQLNRGTNEMIKQKEAQSEAAINAAENAANQYKKATDAFNDLATASMAYLDVLNRLTSSEKAVQEAQAFLTQTIEKYGASSGEAKNAQAALSMEEAKLAGIQLERTNNLQQLNDKTWQMTQSTGALQNTTEQAIDADIKAAIAIRDTMAARGEDTREVQNMIGRLERLKEIRQVDIITNADTEGAKNKLDGIRREIENIPRSRDISISVSGLDPAGLANKIKGAFSSAQAIIAGARAKGGPVNANKPYLVGEEGPELYVPRNSGTIVPSGQTAQMMAGNSSTAIYGNINIGSQSDADYFFSKLARNQELSMRGLSTMAGTVG